MRKEPEEQIEAPEPEVEEAPEEVQAAGEAPPEDGAARRLRERRTKDQARIEALEKQVALFQQEKEAARKAALSEGQRLQEEHEEMSRELEKTRQALLEKDIRMKYRIPEDMVLVGTDRDALEEHAQRLQKYVPRQAVGRTTQPGQEGGNPPSFTRQQLAQGGPAFYEANKDAILQAWREGRVK